MDAIAFKNASSVSGLPGGAPDVVLLFTGPEFDGGSSPLPAIATSSELGPTGETALKFSSARRLFEGCATSDIVSP